MERTNNTSPSDRPNWKHKLIRATALTVAVVFGTATTFMAVASSARAVAMHAGGHESFVMSMHSGHSPEEMHKHFDKVLTEAGASDAQKQQIHAIMKDAMDAEHADMKSFHESCSQLKTLLTAETIDEAAVAKVRDQQDQLLLTTSHRLSGTMLAVAKVLNPAQRAKLGAEIDKMMAEHSEHHHHM
jgi:Spy/CpxP family protein refolding chaperone